MGSHWENMEIMTSFERQKLWIDVLYRTVLQFSGKIDYISSISLTNVLLDVPSVPDDQLAKVSVDTPDRSHRAVTNHL